MKFTLRVGFENDLQSFAVTMQPSVPRGPICTVNDDKIQLQWCKSVEEVGVAHYHQQNQSLGPSFIAAVLLLSSLNLSCSPIQLGETASTAAAVSTQRTNCSGPQLRQ